MKWLPEVWGGEEDWPLKDTGDLSGVIVMFYILNNVLVYIVVETHQRGWTLVYIDYTSVNLTLK